MQATLPSLRRSPRVRTEVLLVATLFLLPTFVGLIIFHWLPLLAAVQNSLLRFSPLNPNAATFVGLNNYVNLLENERFIRATVNTLIYIGGKLALQIPLGLGIALLLNRSLPGTLQMPVRFTQSMDDAPRKSGSVFSWKTLFGTSRTNMRPLAMHAIW